MSIWECKVPKINDHSICGCLPAGFSRLRYFFGKHLNVADFIDEQRYHTTKHRFHNQRLHGAGVLCGLNLSLLEPASTIVRVAKGAALDRCGREVIVGFDQCIDVNAWYQQQRQSYLDDDPLSDWPVEHLTDHDRLPVCVVLRYLECPTQPEPAPRDPCACAEGGCEFGRVSEEFILELYVMDEALPLTQHESFPDQNQITDALTNTFGGVDLLRSLAEPITDACPAGVEDNALLLGCFNAVLSDPERDSVDAIEDLGLHHKPPVLLSTEVIQFLLARLYVDLDVDIGAPSIVDVLWAKKTPGYQMTLVLSGELEPVTIDHMDSFSLRKLADTGWVHPGANAVTSVYAVDDEVPGPAIYISIDNVENYLEDTKRYQLYINQALDPISDSELRELRPHDFVWRFRLLEDAATGDLLMETPPFNINP